MRDVELYHHLLGLQPPWSVTRVELGLSEQRVDVWVNHAEGVRFACPECGGQLPLYDHAESRVWRHLDSCHFLTYVHASIPRVQCPDHGVRQVEIPWALARCRFTTLFECMAIGVLQETDILGAAQILRISWDEAWGLMDRAVDRGLRRKPSRVVPHLGVDEKAIAKGQTYLTLVNDLDRGTVEYIGDDRRKSSLDRYYRTLSPKQRDGIQAVAMDMWEPYVLSTRQYVPDADAKIVFDRYHVMSHLGQAVDTVRKQEQRELRAAGLETLTGSKYLWLYGEDNLPEYHRQRFAALRALDLKTGRAWALKEDLRAWWDYQRRGWAERSWKRWYFRATHSRLQPVVEVAHMLQRHLPSLLTYFTHRISNAVSEGLNSKIQAIKHHAYGFRNRDHFKIAIWFHCGGLDLFPVTHGVSG
jgi:transposase